MPVPEEIRDRLTQWCAARVPDDERDRHQIGCTVQGDEVTIIDRRPPVYPELDVAWSTTPVALLRADDPHPGTWTLYRSADGGWSRESDGPDPVALLDAVAV